MAKISVSIPDDLAGELRDEAVGNVSRFVSSAVRDALDRRRLLRALEALDAEFGPVSADLLDEADAVFDAVEAANDKTIGDVVDVAPGRDAVRIARSRPERVASGTRKVASKASTKKTTKTAAAHSSKRTR